MVLNQCFIHQSLGVPEISFDAAEPIPALFQESSTKLPQLVQETNNPGIGLEKLFRGVRGSAWFDSVPEKKTFLTWCLFTKNQILSRNHSFSKEIQCFLMRFGADRWSPQIIKTVRFPFKKQYFWSVHCVYLTEKLNYCRKTKLFWRLIGNIMRIFRYMFGGLGSKNRLIFQWIFYFSGPRWYPETLCGRSLPQHTCHAK